MSDKRLLGIMQQIRTYWFMSTICRRGMLGIDGHWTPLDPQDKIKRLDYYLETYQWRERVYNLLIGLKATAQKELMHSKEASYEEQHTA